jgi:hypothetical protein
MKHHQYYIKPKLRDRILWWFISIIFVAWVVGVYLKAHGIWKGF